MSSNNLVAEPTSIFVRELSYFDDRAHGLLAVVADALPPAIAQVTAWHPRLGEKSAAEIAQSPFTIDDARLVYARQHGFDSWRALAAHLKSIPANADGEPFLAVFEAAKRGDWNRATSILQAHPEVVRVRGTNGNTMLNLAASLSVCPTREELDRGASSPDRLSAVQLLLQAGANASVANDRGWTPLHQAAYRNDPEMAQLFIDAGASLEVDAHGAGGTPLAVAAFWGHREVMNVLAAVDVTPDNLRMAASVGRVDFLERCFDASGALTVAARSRRAFYRPHSGFPSWRPSDHTQEVLDEALVWAAKSGRVESMPLLLARGANVNADPYRGTPLSWATTNGRLDAMTWLLDHGADVNQRATFGGLSHGRNITALHLAAQSNRADAAKLLLSRGADASIKESNYQATARGWAEHEGARDVLALL